MFSRMGSSAFKKDLTNTILLCDALHNPQTKFKSIHVAGTNGKGSVSHMLAAIFQKAGYKTGLYTSPHLYDFRERIRINGEMISEDFVIDFVERIQPQIEKIEPSFFEITVAMAFDAFAKEKVDIAIIEVGLGGRLDSTNIITPELSVITNIGWDHMNLLGNSLQEIAAEKAGIIKENVPVVIGETLPETKMVFEAKAMALQSAISFAEESFDIIQHNISAQSLSVQYKNKGGEMVSVETDLPGIYQVQNIRTVLTAVNILRQLSWKLDETNVKSALQTIKALTGLMGRWEVIKEKPTVVLEVAHNKEGMTKMLQHLEQLNYNNLHLVLGTVKDKEVNPVLELLPKSAAYYFTQAHIPRALAADELAEKAAAFGLNGNVHDDVNAALKKAIQQASPNDMIVVCGSIFLVAEVDRKMIAD